MGTFIWSCMVISFKGMLGIMFWTFASIAFFLCMAGIFAIVNGIISSFKPKKKQEKTKYEGQPIVVEGGKKDE